MKRKGRGVWFYVVMGIVIFCSATLFGYLSFRIPSEDKVATFLQNHILATPVSERKLTTLIMTGDVMLGRTVEITAKEKHDMNYPFLKVADILRNADISFVNLENPIVKNCKPFTQGFTFCANPEMVDGLVYTGVDIVTLANNHSHNYGEKGVTSTVETLQEKGIEATGIGNLVIVEKNGITFGFLGFDKAQQGNPKLAVDEKELLEDSDKKVDVLIVAMHWGVEYKDKALLGVRSLGHELVAGGADVVVGSHPHWVQDMEYYDVNGNSIPSTTDHQLPTTNRFIPVYYSLGNFVFDQMWSEKTKQGLAVKLTFDGKEIVKEELLPTYMKERGQPEWIKQ